MVLDVIDYFIIVIYLLLSLAIGLYYKNRAGKNMTEFFLGGRNMPWFLAGLSMVATTFAADTPLAVTELVAQNGISGNWLWWNMLFGGMLTTFFFAKMWRRANVLTELELIEIRYSGKEAAFLRGFKSVYMGLFMNSLIIGWVNVALLSLIQVFFNVPTEQLIWYAAAAMLITTVYSSISGLWGVAVTDAVQFVIAMTGCIILAVLVLNADKINGIEGLKAQLPASSLHFFPTISADFSVNNLTTLSITIGAFLSFIAVQWWASWYPGAEPGGGGYIVQRMMSTKNEKHALYATLFFQMANYCLRPWPWIIVGLCTVVLYPDLAVADKKLGYAMAMKDYLPTGLKGLLLVAFLAAYMSTISTQLNWGASYLVNDFYKRFVKPEHKFSNQDAAEKQYVKMGRVFTLFIMLVSLYATTLIGSISAVWEFIIQCGAGLGLVLILRWYWWRINAWSEIAATIAPFIIYFVCIYWIEPNASAAFIANKGTYFITVGGTTICWLLVTYLTKPTDTKILQQFYTQVRPAGSWKPIKLSLQLDENKPSPIGNLAVCWLSAVALTYSVLFSSGKFIFHEWNDAFKWLAVAIVSLIILRIYILKTKILED